MAKTISEIADKVACGNSAGAPNTGKLGCLSLFGTPEHLIALRRGTKIAGNTQFNIAAITTLVKNGTAVPLIGASMFDDTSAEDGYSTNQKGVKRLNLKGLPEYKFTYEEGHEFYRQLDRMGGFKNWDFILGDDEGNWLIGTNADGTYSGMSAGHTTPELTKRKVPGGDAEHKSMLIQFLNRLQFDRNYAILHQEYLDFSPTDIPAVNGVVFEFATVPVAGTSLTVTAKLAQDRTSQVEGLDAVFSVRVNGVYATATAVEDAGEPGKYVLTVPTMATTDVVDVFLGTVSANIVEVDGVLFRSLPLNVVI